MRIQVSVHMNFTMIFGKKIILIFQEKFQKKKSLQVYSS